jgi:hypothetical protein
MGDPSRVREWLSRINLERYFDQFIANGYDDLDTVENLTDEDLDAIGVTLAGHRKRLKATSHESSMGSNPPPQPQQQPPNRNLRSLDSVLGELNAFSADVAPVPPSTQVAPIPTTSASSEDDVDLDALLDDLNKFNPLEQQNTEPGPPPPQPKPVESALPPQPQLQPEPKPKNTHVYHEIQGPTRTIVDKPPELKPRNSSNDLVNGKNSVAPSVSNGGVHQGSALNSPSFHAIPEAKEVHLTGKPTVVHNAKENQAATVEIKERIEQMKQELEQTNLTEKEKEAKLREGKIKLAMEKIKEASVQQVCNNRVHVESISTVLSCCVVGIYWYLQCDWISSDSNCY